VDFEELAEEITDASGADLKAVCTEAGMFAIRDDREEVRMADFYDAWEKIQQTEAEDADVSKTFA
jgi:proteasome regulatory subunit